MTIVIGKPCKKCGSTDRYLPNNRCIPCNRSAQKKVMAANPERYREKQARYRQENRELCNRLSREAKARRRSKNIELMREIDRASRANCVRNKPDVYRKKNRIDTRKWRATHPEEARDRSLSYQRRRYAAKKMGSSLLKFSKATENNNA